MSCFDPPPPPTPERALEMLALCRTKIADLEREIGRISARAALIGNYLALTEAGVGYRGSEEITGGEAAAYQSDTRNPTPDARSPKPDP